MTGNIVEMTPKQFGAHGWVLAREFHHVDVNVFHTFDEKADATYEVGSELSLMYLLSYVLFSSIFFNAADHWKYIKRIVTFGTRATNSLDFCAFLTEQPQFCLFS
jgi:hypothetical protein